MSQTIYPALDQITRTHITTEEAAYYLNRKPQTLRGWAMTNRNVTPTRLCGRLAWPVEGIRKVLSAD